MERRKEGKEIKKEQKKKTIYVFPRGLALGIASIKTKEAKETKGINKTKKINGLPTSFAMPLSFPPNERVTAYRHRFTG